MKKSLVFILLLLLSVSIVLAVSLTREQRQEIRQCRYDCRDARSNFTDWCNDLQDDCEVICESTAAVCEGEAELVRNACAADCDAALGNQTERSAEREHRSCVRQCDRELRSTVRSECSERDCKKECRSERNDCRRAASTDYRSCRSNCVDSVVYGNVTCGDVPAGSTFAQGCEVCECRFDGTVSCRSTTNCHFDEFGIEKSYCEDNGGVFDPVCKGPYFRLRCTRDDFCICGGVYNATCPDDYYCLHDFTVKVQSELEGWKDTIGTPIGDIGVCAKLPDLPHCGDGICQNIIKGIDEPETILNCPEDCDQTFLN